MAREGLRAEAYPRHARRRQRFCVWPVERARIEFGSDLQRVSAVEAVAEPIDQRDEVARWHRVRAAAAEMHCDDAPAQPRRDRIDLQRERGEIRRHPLVPPDRAGVAAAIPADFATVRDVHVQRYRRARRNGGKRGGLIGNADTVVKLRCCRVAGIARDRPAGEFGDVAVHAILVAGRRPTSLDPGQKRRTIALRWINVAASPRA